MLIGDNRFHLTFEPMQCSGGDSGLLLTFEEVLEVLTEACSHDTRTHTHPTIPFDPDSTPKQTWDAIIMLFLLYTTFSVPYQLAFGGGPDISEAVTAFGVFDVCLDCLFCIDVVLNFMTAFTDRGVYVTGWRAIAVHYAKTWFIIDVGGSIPIDKIVSAARPLSPGQEGGGDQVLKALRMVRILKMVRAVRFLQKLKQLEERDTTGSLKAIISVFRAVFLMVFVSHFLACFFFMSIDPEAPAGSWMAIYGDNNGIDMFDFAAVSNWERYVASFYWAVITCSTVGYGDISAHTHQERVISSLAALTGGIVFAFCLGLLQQIISSDKGSAKRLEEQLALIKQYLTFRLDDRDLTRRVLGYFGSCWRDSGAMYDERRLLSDMPRHLRHELFQQIGPTAKDKVSFFKGHDDCTAGGIFCFLEPLTFQEGEYAFRQRDLGEEMYFIEHGTVSLELMNTQKPHRNTSLLPPAAERYSESLAQREAEARGHAAVELGEGDFFGEICLFWDLCKYRHQSARCVGQVSCFVLRRQYLAQIEEFAPRFMGKLYKLCQLRAAIAGVSRSFCMPELAGRSVGCYHA